MKQYSYNICWIDLKPSWFHFQNTCYLLIQFSSENYSLYSREDNLEDRWKGEVNPLTKHLA